MLSADSLAQALDGKRSGTDWIAHCPAHDDRNPSLSISESPDGKLLVKCHAGCSQQAVIEELRKLNLWRQYESDVSNNNRKHIVATYDYQDKTGRLLYQVVRYEPKDFRQRRPDGQGGWIWNLRDVPRVLYRLRELLEANPSGWVFVTEGEKDTDRLIELGLTTTTCPQGAGNWAKVDDSPLHVRGRVVGGDEIARVRPSPARLCAEPSAVANHLIDADRSAQPSAMG